MSRTSDSTVKSSTLADLLRTQAIERGSSPAFTFIGGDGSRGSWTYRELYARACGVAVRLGGLPPQSRVLLAFPPGLDFIAAVYGCLLSDVIAVPAYPPDPSRLSTTTRRLDAIASDCAAAVVLTTSEWLPLATATDLLPESVRALPWIAADNERTDSFRAPKKRDLDAVAVLQYTSGSTQSPKGVMLTHRQLLACQEITRAGYETSGDDVVVGWVPLYHDLGLILHVLHPVYIGAHAILMSPLTFIQRPYRWLAAVSEFKGTVSGGPSFAFELCARKISPTERRTLDLSSWRVAPNGAEPVVASTIERFCSTFQDCGFRSETMMPGYGLAEATLGVTSRRPGMPLLVRRFSRRDLQDGRVVCVAKAAGDDAVSLVGCGTALNHTTLAIADPACGDLCQANQVGEIWVNSPSVGQGYWGHPAGAKSSFTERLPGDTRTFLRTGDLGFVDEGQLFVTGRLKDLIILDGKNHNPEDVELTAQQSQVGLRPGCCAAFQLDSDSMSDRPTTVLVAEVPRGGCPTSIVEVASAVRSCVSEEHGLSIDRLVLIEAGTLPKTSSGKIQRKATRQAYENGELAIIDEWSRAASLGLLESAPNALPPKSAIEAWLRNEIGRLVELPPSLVDLSKPIRSFGLSSKETLLVAADLGAFLGIGLPPGFLFDADSLELVVLQLADPDRERRFQSFAAATWQPWR